MEDYVIHYGADITEAVKKLQQLDRINNRMAKTLGNNFQKATDVIATSLNKVSQTTGLKKVGKGFKEVTTEVFKSGTVIKTTDGKYKNFVETLTVTDGKLVKTRGALTDVTKQYNQNAQATQRASKSTKTFSENVSFLAKRALLVIPLWLLLRSAVTGVINVFKNGIKDIVAFDKILQKSRQNLQGTAEEIDRNFQRLKKSVTALSIETGKSVEEITSAFQRFATVGFDFETAMTGATVSTKLALVLFGDTEKTANALARAFKVLQDRTEDAISPSEQLTDIVVLLRDLWVDNAFTIDEFSGALERFAPVANIANFTAQQTIAILASLQTAGIRGTRAGRLLSTATLQLNKNFEKINGLLGTQVNPKLQTTFERFTFVLKALKELNKVDELSATKAVQELFGGVRGAQAVQALIAIDDVLKENLSRTGDIDKFNKALGEVTDTIAIQAERFSNLKKEAGKAFIASLTGADNFKDSLKEINKIMEGMIDVGSVLGKTLGQVFAFNIGAPYGAILNQLEEISNIASNIHIDIRRAFEDDLDTEELTNLLARIRVFGEEGVVEIDDRTIRNLEKKLIELKSEVKEKLESQAGVDVEIPVKLSLEQQQDIGEEILKLELDRIKATGALDSQLLLAEKALVKQLGLSKSNLDIVKKELELQYALTQEKRNQTKLQSDTLKLFKIAQTEGTRTADRIGALLAGDIDLSDFGRRYKDELDIVKKEFKSFFETQQALQFFRGEKVTGASALKGGTQISIPDEAIRQARPRAFNQAVALRQIKAERQLLRMESKVDVNIEAKLDPADISGFADKIGKRVSQELKTQGTELNNALNEGINNY